MPRLHGLAGAAAGLAMTLALAPADAADTVILGSVGSASTNLWPVYIGINKGLFAAEDIKVDLVFAQSNAAVHQQLAAGSVNFAINTGLVDPIRAIEKGASAAIVRIEVQGPPYILLGRSSIKSMKELKGKTISLGGAKDITRIFVERMLAAARSETRRVRHGVCRRDLGAFRRAPIRRGRRRDPGAAVFLPCRSGRVQQSRPHDRLREGPAVRRHRRQPHLGGQPTGAPSRRCSPSTTRASPGSTTRETAPRRSR